MALQDVAVEGGGPKSTAAASRPSEGGRMLYVDNIRAGLITLVIVGHMAITYGAPIGDWYYSEGEAGPIFSVVATILLGIGAAFLLQLFFMISGYFTPRPYDRKGAGAFLLDRLKRLGIPLVLFAVVINPLVITFLALFAEGVVIYPLLKFVLAALAAIPLCFGLSSLIRRLPYADRVL